MPAVPLCGSTEGELRLRSVRYASAASAYRIKDAIDHSAVAEVKACDASKYEKADRLRETQFSGSRGQSSSTF